MIQSGFYPIKGLKLIFSKGFRRYAIIPVLMNVVIFSSLYTVSFNWFWSTLSNFEISLPSWLSWLQAALNWLGPVFFWVAMVGVGLALLVVLGQVASLITSIFASPFNSLLAEKILSHHHLAPKHVPLAIVFREALVRETKKIIFLLPRLIFVYLIFALCYFMPVINIIGSALLFLFSSWLISFEYIDYSAEANGFEFSQYKQWLKQNRKLAHPFGWVSMSMSTIPGLNLLCVPAGVAGAALLWVESRA